jgi:hypothetical protein
MKIYYSIKNWFLKRKPYFSKEKFLKNTSRYIKREINKNHFDNIMIDLLNNNDVWFNILDGKELIQISKDEFTFKNKLKIFYPNIPIYWVDWKNN